MSPFMQDSFFGPIASSLGFGAVALSILFILLAVWTLLWKALALWYAARNRQKIWFVVFLVVNTVGILEIIYLLRFRKDRNAPGATSLFSIPDLVRMPSGAPKGSSKKK